MRSELFTPINKPSYLGIERASRFKDRNVVKAYVFRAPYPRETFEILSTLVSGTSKIVLDVGCGTGNIARNLIDLVERVDAVDFSDPMIEIGKTLPNGDNPKLHWILGRIEDVPLNPPYSLITAGQSLHWMDWEQVFARFREILVPDGYLAVIDLTEDKEPWAQELKEIVKEYSTFPDYESFDMIAEWERNNLFYKCGEKITTAVPVEQPLEEYLKSLHSASSLSRQAMGDERANKFDDKVRTLVTPFAVVERKLRMKVSASILWGKLLR